MSCRLFQLLRRGKHHSSTARGANRALEASVWEMERADSVLGRYGTGSQESAADPHPADNCSCGRVDAASDENVCASANDNQLEVLPSQHGGRDVDRVGRDYQVRIFRQGVDHCEVRASTVKEQQFASLNSRHGRARETHFFDLSCLDPRCHWDRRWRERQSTPIDAATAAFGRKGAEVAPDRIFGNSEFDRERCSANGLPAFEPGRDHIASPKRKIIVHNRAIY
jgi:hypothetical protein